MLGDCIDILWDVWATLSLIPANPISIGCLFRWMHSALIAWNVSMFFFSSSHQRKSFVDSGIWISG